MEDNVQESRDRLYGNFFARFINRYKKRPSNICTDSIQFILRQNIQCGDTLACKGKNGEDLMITQWSFDDAQGLTISLYSYGEMVHSGSNCKPKQTLPRIPYLLLPAIIRR